LSQFWTHSWHAVLVPELPLLEPLAPERSTQCPVSDCVHTESYVVSPVAIV
jgi:hypothetical protein